jgi:hypothetical protein
VSWVDEHEPDDEEVRRALDDLYGEMKGVRLNTTKRRRRKPLTHERKGKKGRRSPVTDYVRSLGDYLTTAEVAEKVGKSEGWVRKAAAKRWTQAPSYVAPFGDTHVNLYTPEDVEALKAYIAEHHKVYKRDEFPREAN